MFLSSLGGGGGGGGGGKKKIFDESFAATRSGDGEHLEWMRNYPGGSWFFQRTAALDFATGSMLYCSFKCS